MAYDARPANAFGMANRIEHMATMMDRAINGCRAQAAGEDNSSPTINDDTRARLGVELRSIYAELCETQPITDAQVDLLLRLRHKERDSRRAA